VAEDPVDHLLADRLLHDRLDPLRVHLLGVMRRVHQQPELRVVDGYRPPQAGGERVRDRLQLFQHGEPAFPVGTRRA
jgi:hypothetical protein